MGYSTTYIKNGKVEKVGSGGLVPKANFPPGDYEGQIIRVVKTTGHGGQDKTNYYYQWNGSNWKSVSAKEGTQIWSEQLAAAPEKLEELGYGGLGGIEAKPIDAPTTSTLRYPKDKLIDASSDYVVFEFVKYNPPFGRDSQTNQQRYTYNAGVTNDALEKVKVQIDDGIDTLVLPMPQDLSNEMKQNWEGKSFSGLGKGAIGALAGGNLSFTGDKVKDLGNNLKALTTALTASALNSVPGVGGNLSINDLTGATRGIVLNPNAELLYDSPDLREIGMTFKMVPRNETEAKQIRSIVNTFRSASLPQWGSQGADEGLDSSFTDVTFISVPLLCKFTFMTGPEPHKYIAQFKPCAIRQVQVNYTPDGTYATYDGEEKGAPVATELTVQFLETKLVYASEIKAGF